MFVMVDYVGGMSVKSCKCGKYGLLLLVVVLLLLF